MYYIKYSKTYNMRIIVLSLLLFLSFLFGSNVFSQTEKFKALYIYNFTKHVEWPGLNNDDDFIICVLGNSPIYQHLTEVVSQRKVAGKNIIVQTITDLSTIPKCHILYISHSKKSLIDEAKSKLNNGTLIVTDKKGQIPQGASICLFEDNGHLKFEISKNNISNSGLRVSSELINLGILIN